MTVKIVKFGAFYVGVGVTGSKFAYRFFWFRSLSWKGWVLNRYESEKNVEKIMASSAQPTRLSKLSFPRYTTSLATTPRVHPSLALLHTPRSTRHARFCPLVSHALVT